MESDRKPRLVLLGGGHAHVQVLKRWPGSSCPDAELHLVNDRALAVYSGMVPGLIAGQYTPPEISIDLVPLARRAGATLIVDRVARVDANAKLLHFAERPALPFDLLSFNVGGSVRGLELPGVRESALRTRPIHQLVDQLERLDRTIEARGRALRTLVVGGGAAGVELAFALAARCAQHEIPSHVRLIEGSEQLLPSFSDAARRYLERELEERGIETLTAAWVRAVERDGWVLDSRGRRHPFDLLVWATGATGPAFLRHSALPTDADGFLLVRSTLQVMGHDDLFAVGDCAHLVDAPWVPKSGVYAVRQGPVLYRNLVARLRGTRLEHFRPQKHALALINLGDGRALALKWKMARAGKHVMQLKDAIDRRFVRSFQIPDSRK